MHKRFVYLNVSQKRLMITSNEMNDKECIQLMNNNGGDIYMLEGLCKTFCLGYILGSKGGIEIANSLHEFR